MNSVSVIIPAYNSKETIGRAIKSVLAQSIPPLEILIVDDGSKEDLRPLLASFSAVEVLRQENGGAASARNLGIERARGEIVAFLDADDYWEPTKLEKQIAIFEKYPEVSLVAGKYFEEQPGRPRQEAKLGKVTYGTPIKLDGAVAFAFASQVWTGTVAIRRIRLGSLRFVSGLEPAEDRDLWFRILRTEKVFMIETPLATAVLEPNSLSRSNIARAYGNTLKVVHRHREELGHGSTRGFEKEIYRRWTGRLLESGNAAAARLPAWQRVKRQPLSLEGWYALLKSLWRAIR